MTTQPNPTAEEALNTHAVTHLKNALGDVARSTLPPSTIVQMLQESLPPETVVRIATDLFAGCGSMSAALVNDRYKKAIPDSTAKGL